MLNATTALASLRPRSHANIMDLVHAAGIDVTPWGSRADGSAVEVPRANPNFCYDWAFGGDKEPTVLCVWHENLRVDGEVIVYTDNFQETARRLEAVAAEPHASNKVRSRAKSQAKRAWEFDRKLQHAFRKSRPLRLVLLEGHQRDRSELGIDASAVRYRHLDGESWSVQTYDDRTGAFRIVRRSPSLLGDANDAYQQVSGVSVETFVDVFVELDMRLTGRQREMLVGHAVAPVRTLSMEKIASLGGYDSYAAANLQYGALGGMVADALGIRGLANSVQALCELSPTPDEAGHAQWTIRQSVFEALATLGMLPSPEGDNAEREMFRAVLAESPEIASETPTARKALIEARLGQGTYRRKMLRWWGSACALTGCTVEEVLVASHAVPWKTSAPRERLDHYNGLLLAGTLDRLFDAGLIGFSREGLLLISSQLNESDRTSLGISEGMRLRKIDDRMIAYLERHRKLHGL